MAKSGRTAWFIIRGEKRFGPFNSDELREYVAQGRLTAEDLLWKEGLAEPVKAGKVGKLGLENVVAKPVVVEMPPELDGGVIDLSRLAKKAAAESVEDWNILNENLDSVPAVKVKKPKRQAPEDVGASGALAQAIGRGIAALGEFFSHPLRHSFLLLVLIISCSLAVLPLLTVILVPAFFIGYIHCIDGMLGGEKASVTRFLSFLRHGWDSLWHLLMMQAALLLLVAMTIAPAVIVGMFFVGTFGTATFGMIEVAGIVASSGGGGGKREPEKVEMPRQRPEGRKELPRNRIPDDAADFGEPEAGRMNRGAGRPPAGKAEGSGLFSSIMEGVLSLGETVVRILVIIVVGAVGCLVLTPLASAMVLAFCLVYRVALGGGVSEQKFDLVYNALESTIRVATGAWGRVLSSGLWICGLPLLLTVLNFVVTGLVFAKLGLYFLSMWVGTVVTPIFGFLLMGHLGIFLVMTARDLLRAEG